MPTASDPPHEGQLLFDRSVPVLDGSGGEHTARIVAATLPDEGDGADELGCTLELTLAGTEYRSRGYDFWEALLALRERIEPDGWRLRCYGASLNVWPSGMTLQMTRGLQAYHTDRADASAEESLVHIFDTGPDVIPATVKEQERYCLGPPEEDVGALRSMLETARRWIRLWIRERRRKRAAVRLAMEAFRAGHDESPRRASVIGSSGWDIIVRVIYSDGHKPPARAWYAVSPNEKIRELSWEVVERMKAEWR